MSSSKQLTQPSDKYVSDYTRGDFAACSMAYAEDAVMLERDMVPIVARSAIIQKALEHAAANGVVVTNLITEQSESDGGIGYAIQLVETTGGTFRVMLAMRRTPVGVRLAAAETVVA